MLLRVFRERILFDLDTFAGDGQFLNSHVGCLSVKGLANLLDNSRAPQLPGLHRLVVLALKRDRNSAIGAATTLFEPLLKGARADHAPLQSHVCRLVDSLDLLYVDWLFAGAVILSDSLVHSDGAALFKTSVRAGSPGAEVDQEVELHIRLRTWSCHRVPP